MAKMTEFYAAATDADDEVMLELQFDDGRTVTLFFEVPEVYAETMDDRAVAVHEKRIHGAFELARILRGEPSALQDADGQQAKGG